MPLKTITDRKGHQFRWDEYEGHGALEIISQFLIPEGFEAKIKQIKTLAIRDDDIMVCTFPKAGTFETSHEKGGVETHHEKEGL